MAHPLVELQKLLQPKPLRKTGKVVNVEAGKVYVATDKGVIVRDQNSANYYKAGDTVVLVAGEIVGRQMTDDERPVFVI